MTGKFFILEGIECSGKTTLFKNLQDTLKNEKVYFISETAERFSKLFPDIYNNKEEMEIAYLIDNTITINKVSSLIEKDVNVIMDRSWVSQPVYIRIRKELNSNYDFDIKMFYTHEKILRRIFPEVYNNTVVIYLDVDIHTVVQRLKNDKAHHRADEFSIQWAKKAKDYYATRLKEISDMGVQVEYIDANKSVTKMLNLFLDIYRRYLRMVIK